MRNTPKTSLEKSHSPWSNFKLTLLCLLGSVGFSGFFVGLGLLGQKATPTLAFGVIAGGVLASAISLLGISQFKR